MEVKYSIILTYYKRPHVIRPVLDSFLRYYSNRKDYEVVIAIDPKNRSNDIDELKTMIEPYWMGIKMYLVYSDLISYQGDRALNIGGQSARGKYIVVTSIECVHQSDILSGLDAEYNKVESAYVVCACRALRPDGNFEQWYQHSTFNNRLIPFCACLDKRAFESLGWIDEEYSHGLSYSDDDLRERIKRAGIPIIIRDDLIVDHLWHDRSHQHGAVGAVQKNYALYMSKKY